MKLWLDDVREPPDSTWTWVTTMWVAQSVLIAGKVIEASLDHDLGPCYDCQREIVPPNCNHKFTGYDLVCWMKENDIWPVNRPNVHSANPVGRDKMLAAINRKYG